MNSFKHLIPFGIAILAIFVCILPSTFSQCVSNDDDMSKAGATDLTGLLKFNLDLFRELVPPGIKDNFVFSPYSIWNALTLAYFGSNRATERQFKRVLRVGNKLSTLRQWRALEYLYYMRNATNNNNKFVVANRAFFDKTVFLRFCMVDILHNEMQKIDFSQPAEAAIIINNFVSETTRGAIEELVSAADVSDARMVLANAAFFKGTWKSQFDVRDTRPATFYNLDSTLGTVDMMMQFGDFKYGYDDKMQAQVLELPYEGSVLSMYIFLPYTSSVANFDEMIHEMSAHRVESVINGMFKTNLKVNLPKFSIESHVGGQLMDSLKSMGLTDAFDRQKADFSYFTLFERLSLDNSIHKAFIQVNEQGTEAGAATAFIATKIASDGFECNKPFVYVIRDNETKNLLFIGTFKHAESKSNGSKVPPKLPTYPDPTFQVKF